MRTKLVYVCIAALTVLTGCASYSDRIKYEVERRAAFAAAHPDEVVPEDTSVGLNWLIYSPDNAAVRKIVDSGTAINEAKRDGWTPLATAVYFRNSEIVDFLLSKGADPRIPNKDGTFPIQYAAGPALLKKLAAAGAKLDVVDSSGNGLIQRILSAFLEEKSLYLRSKERNKEYLDSIRYCLEAGLDPNARNNKGEYALKTLLDKFKTFPVPAKLMDRGSYLDWAKTAVLIENNLYSKKPVLEQPEKYAENWLYGFWGLTRAKINEALVSSCMRMDYFDYSTIWLLLEIGYIDKNFRTKPGAPTALEMLQAQMKFNVPKTLELARSLKAKDAPYADIVKDPEARALGQWLNIDIPRFSPMTDMFTLQGRYLEVSMRSSAGFFLASLIVSRIEEYEAIIKRLEKL